MRERREGGDKRGAREVARVLIWRDTWRREVHRKEAEEEKMNTREGGKMQGRE